MFAFGAALTAYISLSTGAPMIIAYGLFTISGSCFVGGLSLSLITKRLH